MCFSANASFASGAILTIAGIVCLKKAKGSSQKTFAAIPFIFAIQQFSEGLVWLSLSNNSYAGLGELPMNIYLVFANSVWPFYVPLSILLIEKNVRIRNFMYILLGTGLVLTAYYAYCLATYPVSARIEGHHIRYIMEYPSVLFTITNIFYGMATILPALISSIGRMKWLGIFISVAYIVTSIFFNEYITSVWCYFAALISIIIYWILSGIGEVPIKIIPVKFQV